MRNRLLGALAAGTLLLTVPAGALAQETDPCYVDPTAPGCVDVGVDDAEVDDGEVADDGEVTDDGTEVRREAVVRTSSTTGTGTSTGVLARTGLETGTLVALFVGLLAAGGALLVAGRRRGTNN
jgi:LPXTG-motif cell wall-anchored protein